MVIPGGRSMSMVTVAMTAYQARGPAHGCPHQAGIPTGTLAKTQPRESPEIPRFAPKNGRPVAWITMRASKPDAPSTFPIRSRVSPVGVGAGEHVQEPG